MVVWSKTIDYSCYELGHTWEPSCRKAVAEVALHGFSTSFKIYAPLYLIAAIVRKKKKDYYLKRLLPEILQSTFFLGTNAFAFIGGFCLWRTYLTSEFSFLSSAFLPAMTACYVSIITERKSRRGVLAVYLANLASEVLYNMAESRGYVKSIKNGEVLFFSIVVAIYMYLYRQPNGLKDAISSGIRFIVGSADEAPRPPSPIEEIPEPIELNPSSEAAVSSSSSSQRQVARSASKRPLLSYMPKQLQILVTNLRQLASHRLCNHQHSCVSSSIERGVRLFCSGYAIQALIKLLGAVPQAISKGKPRAILDALRHKDNVYFGAFLGSFAAIFKAVNCVLRWLRNTDSELHGLVSGFIAAWSMLWYKSSSIAMYMASKLVEILYFKGIESGHLPYIRSADILIYTISTSIVFHAAVFEPHNLRPAYWKFLDRLTNGRFYEMNRKLLDVYGTNASKLMPDFWPKYDPRYSNLPAVMPPEFRS